MEQMFEVGFDEDKILEEIRNCVENASNISQVSICAH